MCKKCIGQKNEGHFDRIMRLVLAVIFLVLAWSWFDGAVQIVLYILSVILFVTALTGHCCLYKLCKLNTNQDKDCCQDKDGDHNKDCCHDKDGDHNKDCCHDKDKDEDHKKSL